MRQLRDRLLQLPDLQVLSGRDQLLGGWNVYSDWRLLLQRGDGRHQLHALFGRHLRQRRRLPAVPSGNELFRRCCRLHFVWSGNIRGDPRVGDLLVVRPRNVCFVRGLVVLLRLPVGNGLRQWSFVLCGLQSRELQRGQWIIDLRCVPSWHHLAHGGHFVHALLARQLLLGDRLGQLHQLRGEHLGRRIGLACLHPLRSRQFLRVGCGELYRLLSR